MRLLLDTHVAIWWLSGDRRLSPSTRRAIEDATTACLSAVSIWEMAIKQDTGRLDLPDGFIVALRDDFVDLPLTMDHAVEGRRLPTIHRDPFDRMLVAQARLEGLTLVTADRVLTAYAVPILSA
jgi:PIN domain nuclease of toxin-antitoxin system